MKKCINRKITFPAKMLLWLFIAENFEKFNASSFEMQKQYKNLKLAESTQKAEK